MITKVRPLYLKEFLYAESLVHQVSPAAIKARIDKGQYAGQIRLERKGTRTILVTRLTTAETRTA